MITGNGINTVTVNGKVKHITELDDITLCLEWTKRKRLVRTVLIFTESSDQLSRATDRVPGLPASPGYVQ